jgi:hypothetical protein
MALLLNFAQASRIEEVLGVDLDRHRPDGFLISKGAVGDALRQERFQSLSVSGIIPA